jgi:hypothetical protein
VLGIGPAGAQRKTTLRSLYEAMFWRSFDVRKMSKPAVTLRSRK